MNIEKMTAENLRHGVQLRVWRAMRSPSVFDDSYETYETIRDALFEMQHRIEAAEQALDELEAIDSFGCPRLSQEASEMEIRAERALRSLQQGLRAQEDDSEQ